MSAALVPITRVERNASAEAIKALRQAHGLTQKQFGRISGTSKELVCRWEKKGVPSVWIRLARIADSLGCSADEILGRTVAERPVDALSAQDRELLDAFRAIAVATFGPRIGEQWRRIARYQFSGFLAGRLDQDLIRSDNGAPYVEEAAAQHRVAVQRAVERGRPLPRYVPPEPRAKPEVLEPLKPIDGRLYPEGYFTGWESPRVRARRLNRPDAQKIKRERRLKREHRARLRTYRQRRLAAKGVAQ